MSCVAADERRQVLAGDLALRTLDDVWGNAENSVRYFTLNNSLFEARIG